MNTMLFVMAVAVIFASAVVELLKQWRRYLMRKCRRDALLAADRLWGE